MLNSLLQVLSTRIMIIPLGLVCGILTARYLGPSDRGLLTLLLMFPQTVTVLGGPVIQEAAMYFHRKEKVPLETLFANCVMFALFFSITISAALWLSRDLFIQKLFPGTTNLAYAVVILTVPLIFFTKYLRGLLRAVEDFTSYKLQMLFEKLFFLAGILVTFLVLDGKVLACLVTYFVASLLVCIWLVWKVYRNLNKISPPNFKIMLRMLLYGYKSYAGNIAATTHSRLDVYLIALYLTNSEVAFYALAAGLAERLFLIPNSLVFVIGPRLSSLNERDAAKLVTRACRSSLLLVVSIGFVTCLFGRQLIQLLYGQEYVSAALPMYILILGTGSIGATKTIFQYFTSRNMQQYNTYLTLFSAAVNVVLNIVLIPHFGIIGAAISSLLTYSLQAVLTLAVFVKTTGFSARETLLVDRRDLQHLLRVSLGLLARRFSGAA